jgi:hypothetical protein
MPMNIVREYPGSAGRLRRVASALATIAGGVLILAGLLAAVLPILYLAVAVASLGLGGRGPAPDVQITVYAVAAATLVSLGLWLVRGKRQLVLFLRRFGFVEATQAVTFAVVRALGAHWRLVTLDDSEVSPVGVRKRMRWLSIAVGLVAATGVAWAISWLAGGGLDALVGEATKGALRGATLRDVLPRMVVWFFVVPVILMIAVTLLIFIPAAFGGAVAIFAWSSYGAIRAAERAKTVQITDEAQIERAAAAVLRRSRGIVGPRLAVARVVSAIWQPVVRRLISASSAVIIDVSEPTRNLLWEIETLTPEMRSRCILVGEQAHLDRMTTGAAEPESSPRARLLRLLDGEQVLAYSSEKENLMRFARSLHARLDTLRL